MAVRSPRFGLLLAPGAGSDSEHSALRAIELALEPDVVVHRMDFPYRKAGRRAPDRQPVLEQAVRDEAASFAKRARLRPEHLFMGGRSMGGRMCSTVVANGFPCAGLVLVSYPLHPPGKPEKLRIDHFDSIGVPVMFLSGDRDAFGTKDELRRYVRRIKAPKSVRFIPGDHGLKGRDDDVAERVAAWVRAQIG